MKPIYVSGLLSMAKNMGVWSMDDADDHQPINRDLAERNVKAYLEYLPILTDVGISGCHASLQKIIAKLKKDPCTWADIKDLASEMSGRLVDETKDKTFFALSLRETEIYRSPLRGWDLAIGRFPDIRDDVEEASKSYALSRYPAAVFHSVQIIEAGLIELGMFLKVADPHSGWTSVSSALKKVIDKKHQDRTRFEKKNFHFLEQMQGLVHGLKNAWRNKISHAHGRLVLISKEFSPDTAEEIVIATRAFMRRLAEELPPAKPKKGAKK